MNNQNENSNNDELIKTELTHNAWIDVKLCTISSKENKRIAPGKLKTNALSPANASSANVDYEELHNGNYE